MDMDTAIIIATCTGLAWGIGCVTARITIKNKLKDMDEKILECKNTIESHVNDTNSSIDDMKLVVSKCYDVVSKIDESYKKMLDTVLTHESGIKDTSEFTKDIDKRLIDVTTKFTLLKEWVQSCPWR